MPQLAAEKVCAHCKHLELPDAAAAPGGDSWCQRWDMPIPDPPVTGCLEFAPREAPPAPPPPPREGE